MQSDTINELATALSKAQAKFSAVPKTSVNPFFKSKYADLATVVQSANPILTELGLSISQHLSHDGELDTLTTYLLHSSGQYIASTMRLHLTKEDAQGQGSATTYARRYAYMAVLGLVADEDDDGNKASAPKPQTAPAPAKPGLTNVKREQLKRAFQEAATTGQAAIDFAVAIIGKSAPTTDAEADHLIEAVKSQEPF